MKIENIKKLKPGDVVYHRICGHCVVEAIPTVSKKKMLGIVLRKIGNDGIKHCGGNVFSVDRRKSIRKLKPNETGYDTGVKTSYGNPIRVGDYVETLPEGCHGGQVFYHNIPTPQYNVVFDGTSDAPAFAELTKSSFEFNIVEYGTDKYGRQYKKEW